MKVRNGFVSNSSSSSFVIALDRTPASVKDVEDLFFSDGHGVCNDWSLFGVDGRMKISNHRQDAATSKDAAKLIWQQISDQQPATETKIKEALGDGIPEMYDSVGVLPEEKLMNAFEDLYENKHGHSPGSEHWEILKAAPRKEIGTDKFLKRLHPELRKWHDLYETAREARLKHEKKCTDAYFDANIKPSIQGKTVYVVEFSDNDPSPGSAMEHGNTFRNVNHWRISHH